MSRQPPRSTLCPYTTLFRSDSRTEAEKPKKVKHEFVGYSVTKSVVVRLADLSRFEQLFSEMLRAGVSKVNNVEFHTSDRKSTRLNSSHANISYAVFCLKKKT